MDLDDIIAAFRNTHTGIARMDGGFSAKRKEELLISCEVLIYHLKGNDFLRVLQEFGAADPDGFDYIMEEVMQKLNLESVDPIYRLLTKEQAHEN